jgi:hypothetical protein
MIMKGIQYIEVKDIFILYQMSYLIKIALILSTVHKQSALLSMSRPINSRLSAHQRHQQPTKQFSLPGVRRSYPIGLNYRPII